MIRIFFAIFMAVFLSACAKSSFVQSSIQTNNEGIFLKAKAGESFKIIFHNPNSHSSDFAEKLALNLKNLGLKESFSKADYEILINYIDLKKHSYAQRISTAASFFYDLDPLENNGEWLVENFYTLQINIQIQNKEKAQSTKLFARTAYLSDKKRCQLSLEHKIIQQIVSFFYLD